MWLLDYDGNLILHLQNETTDALARSAFYKLSLRRYVKDIATETVYFRPSLTYLDYKKIITLCRIETEKRGIELTVTNALAEFISAREMHLEIRSRLGIELKSQDEKLSERFDQYRETVDSLMTRKLRDKQMWDSFFMYSMKKSANFSVPGSGKTASVLGVYAYLRNRENVSRIVVVCPKNAFGSWMDEFTVCFSGIETLRVMNIHDPQYKNQKQRRSALQFHSGACNLILVNYEAVSGVFDELADLVDSSALLVFDEVHKVKRVNGEYADHALKLAKKACHVIAMTGTPIPNSYLDVYNLLHILYPDEYDDMFDFSIPMLRQPNADEVQEINDKLQPFFCRTSKEQLGVPPVNPDALCEIRASDVENKLLHILKMKYRRNKLALLIRILQLESDPKLLLTSLDLNEFAYLLDDSVEASEIDYADYSEEVKQLIDDSGVSSKFSQCTKLVSSLVSQGKPVIVWCMFVASIQRLEQALSQLGIPCKCVYGEVALDERQQILADFKSGKIQVLLTNPHTLAESVSLHSVCHDAIYFEYSYNLVHLLQSKDRIHRLGLPEHQYTQYHYMQLYYDTNDSTWSLDQAIYDRLCEKERIMLDAINNRVLEVMPTSEDELDVIFNDSIIMDNFCDTQ